MSGSIILTKQQQECVDYKGKNLLVKGVPGAGKSVVVLRRALKCYKEALSNDEKASVRIFTYTNTLVQYTKELIDYVIKNNTIDVSTVDKLFRVIYLDMRHKRSIFIDTKGDKLRALIQDAIQKHKNSSRKKHRLYDVDLSFWVEEIQWIQEKCIVTENDYINASRRGRGSNIKMMSEDDKKLAWGVYSIVRDALDKESWTTFPAIYLYLSQHLDEIPDKYKIKHVFVDEAQDLTVGKLKALRAIATDTITIAADMAQKIYKTSFTWKETGIDIQGRASKSLNATFRSTKQIVMLAEDLNAVNRKDVDLGGELTDIVLPETNGVKPIIVYAKSKTDQLNKVVGYLKNIISNNPNTTIGIICKTWKMKAHFGHILSNNNIPYQDISQNGGCQILAPGVKLIVGKSSKGLEFDAVFIPEVEEGQYPFIPSNLDDEQEEEFLSTERNQLYVEMTRARRLLIMFCTEANQSRFMSLFNTENYQRG